MSTILLWIVMLLGALGLFVFRFATESKRRLRVYAPKNFRLEKADVEVGTSRDADARNVYAKRPKIIKAAAMSAMTLTPITISMLVLLSALYIILFKDAHADPQQKWAFGVVGTILGYWLKQ